MVEIGTDYLLRLHTRLNGELKYIEDRLADKELNPKTQIVLTIMKKRIQSIISDAEKGVTNLSFKKWLEREASKIVE